MTLALLRIARRMQDSSSIFAERTSASTASSPELLLSAGLLGSLVVLLGLLAMYSISINTKPKSKYARKVSPFMLVHLEYNGPILDLVLRMLDIFASQMPLSAMPLGTCLRLRI
eukprot:4076697-Pleurochrysis_carterae.AAC.2